MIEPYRKRFDNETAFPFELVYRDTKSAQNELPDHLHDWYELVYVYSGRGTFFIDQTFYDAEADNIFLIPGNTIHRSFPDPAQPKTSTAIFFHPSLVHASPLGDSFSYLRCFEQSKRKKGYKLIAESDVQAPLQMLIEQIHDELVNMQPGYRHSVQLYLQQLLLLINRAISPVEMEHSAAAIGPPWMTAALAYIDEHPESPLGMSQLAKQAAVTPAHFSRVFKSLTGLTVTEYVTTKKVIRAKELLIDTDATIAEIAEQCGFESLPHFHRTFKKMTGLTPTRYKRSLNQ